MKENVLFKSQAEYEKWICDNKDIVKNYFAANDVPLIKISFSARSYNILRMNHKNGIADIVLCSDDELSQLDMITRESLNEILMYKRNILRSHKKSIIDFFMNSTKETSDKIGDNNQRNVTDAFSENSKKTEKTAKEDSSDLPEFVLNPNVEHLSESKKLLATPKFKNELICFFEKKQIGLSSLDLSARSKNVLRRYNISYIHELIAYYPNGFAEMYNLGKNSVDEICSKIVNCVSCFYEEILSSMKIDSAEADFKKETDPFKLTVQEMLVHPLFKDKAVQFIQSNNVAIEEMGFSVRAYHSFARAGLLSFADILDGYPDCLFSLRNVGVQTLNEIQEIIDDYTSRIHNHMASFCSGDLSALYTEEYMCDTIMSRFRNIDFQGVSFKEIRAEFPEDFDDEFLKKHIGRLLADKRLEYVDFRLYRVYPSVYKAIDEFCASSEDKEIVLDRFGGMTLDVIAKSKGITKERIRQKIDKQLKLIRQELNLKYGFSVYDEDYYAYLYSTYDGSKELWENYLGVSEKTIGYLNGSYRKGKNPIETSLSDPKVNLVLKFKIQDYLNRNKISINGVLIEKQRAVIEKYALSLICKDELHLNEFMIRYNELLQANGVDYDEKLYFSDTDGHSRAGRLQESMYCLWKHGERMRYYDIAGHDYTELLQTLNLKKYRNTEVSTLKFIEDYPEIMEKYDIRDQYELHNLLKKIINTKDYEDINFKRQPIICFGEFDRTKAMYEILAAVSPVSIEDLVEYIHMEYGYDRATTMSSYIQPLNQYYHQGMYVIDFPKIPEERKSSFKAKLTEEFYYISEIKEKYTDMFEDADVDEINPFSLKSIGFTVLTTYALQNYKTAEAYFTDLLTRNDICDISEYNERFYNIRSYFDVYRTLRLNYDIFVYEKNKIITMNRLNKLGIQKDDIKEFCKGAKDFVNEGDFFTIRSLRESGYEFKIDELGFEDQFYAWILAAHPDFICQSMFGEIVLSRKISADNNYLSIKSFILYALSKYESVDIDEFIDDCYEEYGIKIPDRYEIVRAVADTEVYYDSIMDKIYKNKNLYYSEFDD